MLVRIASVSTAVLLTCACSTDDLTVLRPEPPEPEESAPIAAAPSVPGDVLDRLEALGYVDTQPAEDPDARGVTTGEPEAWPGLNLYGSRHRAAAVLTDMQGRVVHRWAAADDAARERRWMHMEPLPSGELLVIDKDRDLTRLDWDSNVVWRRRMRAHHDLAVRDDGHVFVLVRGVRTMHAGGRELPVLVDSIAHLSPEGEILATHPLLPLVRHWVSRRRLARLSERLAREGEYRDWLRCGLMADVLHTNSIAFLHRDIPGVAPAGSILLSFRALDRVAIVDAGVSEVLFAWGAGEVRRQHDATQIENGNLLIFDNGLGRGYSRVVELDPIRREIVWTYEDRGSLYSPIRGGAQQLPNGNVLVTESESGHALEVTRSGRVVWELWNPELRGRERSVIYRLNRFAESFFEPLARR